MLPQRHRRVPREDGSFDKLRMTGERMRRTTAIIVVVRLILSPVIPTAVEGSVPHPAASVLDGQHTLNDFRERTP